MRILLACSYAYAKPMIFISSYGLPKNVMVIGKPWDPKPIGTTMEGKPTELYPDIVAGTGASDFTKAGSSIV